VNARGAAEPPLVIDASARAGHSIEEAARRVGVGRSQMYRLVAGGEIDSIKIGRRRIIPESAIQDFLDRKLAESRAARAERAFA
jgi:excisionase family DNA binding protein